MHRQINSGAAPLGAHLGALAPCSSYEAEPSPLSRLLRLLKGAWEAYWSWRAKCATVAILRTLDRRTLADIGLQASEIESAVFGAPGDRPRAYDEAWWH